MSELKRCPLCGTKMETTNYQHYFHPDNDCILHGFGIDINERRSVKAWNTRKPMERIVERLEEENTLIKEQRKEAIEYDDEQMIFATNNQIRAFDYSLRVIKEGGGMNEN